MKRHPSLAKLSREHHGALLLARLLQKNAPAYKGLPADTAGKADYALKFYKTDLVKHFEEEEAALQFVQGISDPLDLLVQTIFREHKELHQLFKSIDNRPGLPEHLDELGKALEIHVRKEERELFPLIEESCTKEQMKAIGHSLSPHSS